MLVEASQPPTHQPAQEPGEAPPKPKDQYPAQFNEVDFVLLANIAKALVSSMPAETIAQMPAPELAQRLLLMHRALADRV